MTAWKTVTVPFIVITAVWGPVGAQTNKPVESPPTVGREKVVSFQTLPGLRCYTFRSYAVIEKQDTAAVGNDVLVKYRKSSNDRLPCAYLVKSSDFEIKNRLGNSFLGLLGDLIFIESGTGANVDGLAIYNLSLRKKVFETGIADDGPVGFIGPRTVTLWEPARDATKENCPRYRQIEAEGLQPTLEEQYTLDLVKFSSKFTGRTRCSAYE